LPFEQWEEEGIVLLGEQRHSKDILGLEEGQDAELFILLYDLEERVTLLH
jgi:hypothetical protein